MSLFPGMNPYFEHPEIWSGVHLLLIGIPDVAVQRSQRQAEIQLAKVAIAALPSQPIPVRVPITQTIRQGYLEVREVATKEVITAVEVLSPINKRSGRGGKPMRLSGNESSIVRPI